MTGTIPSDVLRVWDKYGLPENVRRHCMKVAEIAERIARRMIERGVNVDLDAVIKGALLHDIGRAVTHEPFKHFVEIGKRILEKFGVDKAIIQAMQAHHEEYPYETLESVIVQVADQISGARPGARKDTAEQYIKRMEDLEALAGSFEGVEKVYAIYAGREVRVFVKPTEVDDLKAIKLAQDIAKRIEQEMQYPGEVKVNVIRETRADARAR